MTLALTLLLIFDLALCGYGMVTGRERLVRMTALVSILLSIAVLISLAWGL